MTTQQPMPPTTTAEQDVNTANQRRVNLIWEFTQATVTVIITFAVVFLAVKGTPDETIKAAFFIIIGFYFSRTNHTQIGGIGAKLTDNKTYDGR